MNCKVMLFLGGELEVELFKADKLGDVDYFTALYRDKRELLIACSDIICSYFNISNSSNEFLKILEKGKVKICFNDIKGYPKKINPIYKAEKSKLNPNSMRLFITRSLKEDETFELVKGVLDNFEYMFNSQFNISRNNLYGLKNTLLNTNIDNNSIMKFAAKDKFIEIVKDELSRDYNKNTKTTSLSSYIKLRLIYDYIVRKKKKLKKKQDSDDASIEDILFDEFMKDFDKSEFTTMGDLAYQYDLWKEDKKVFCKV